MIKSPELSSAQTEVPSASDPNWKMKAACRPQDERNIYDDRDIFFGGRDDDESGTVEKGKTKSELTREAKAICQSCIARLACLDYALTNRIGHGVWGGLDEDERKKLRRKRSF